MIENLEQSIAKNCKDLFFFKTSFYLFNMTQNEWLNPAQLESVVYCLSWKHDVVSLIGLWNVF